MKRAFVLVAAVTIAMAVAACGDSGDESAGTSIDAVMTEFAFDPDSWVVPANSDITIDLDNNGTIEHEWVLLRPGVTITSEDELPDTEEELLADFVYWEDEVEPGDSKQLTFTSPAAGTYQVICAIEGHFNAGMEGQLVVE
jgi:uncharacterized cupredoxin-like copper-binding protein